MFRRRFLLVFGMVIMILLGLGFHAYQSRSASQPALLAPVFQDFPANLGPKPAKGTQTPPGLTTCLGLSGAEYEVTAVAKDRGKTFYLLSVYDIPQEKEQRKDPFVSGDQLIALKESFGCLGLVSPETGVRPLSLYMSVEAARDMELQRYRRWIKQMGGKQNFQKVLRERITEYFDYLTVDQVWALQQLGITYPSTYQLFTPEMFKDDSDERWRLDLLYKQ